MAHLPVVNPLTAARQAYRWHCELRDHVMREVDGLRQQLQEDVVREVGGGLARGLDEVPDRHLEFVMTTPARRVVLDGIFWGAPAALNRTPLANFLSSLHCRITAAGDREPDLYWLRWEEGRWRSGRGLSERSPQVTLTVQDTELLRLALGRSTPVQSFFAGRLRASGNPLLTARLTSLATALLAPRPA